MNQIRLALTCFALVSLLAACAEGEPTLAEDVVVEEDVATTPPPDYYWVQMGVGGAVIARAIYTAANQTCPSIETTDQQGNKARVSMQNRVGTGSTPSDFDVTVCEATLADNLQAAMLGGKALALPTGSPQRILVVGDTGCRMKGSTFQNCNDSLDLGDEWLFKATVSSARAQQSDLAIHVGDYIYREAACPAGNEGCDGSPYGQNWATWAVDFFEPADTLLKTVPWVFARGNHESCEREWHGWYLFLDPHPLGNPDSASWSGCSSDQYRSAPFAVPLDSLQLLVMDSAESADASDYQAAFETQNGSNPAWFITHQPLWGVGASFHDAPPIGVVADAQQVNVKFLVSGHLHLFEMIQFAGNASPPQLIAGGGATELDDFVSQSRFAQVLNNDFQADVNTSEVLYKFTFVVVEVQPDGWHVKVIDQDGTTEARSFIVKKT